MAPRFGNIPWNKGVATKHGDWGSREYRIWTEIRHRCNRLTHHAYARYGGRGIQVCERWSDYSNFLADMGRRPSDKHQIDRINNDGNYEPSNCRWATPLEQARNRSNNSVIKVGDESMTVVEAAERFGVPAHRIRQRLARGYSVTEAIHLPPVRNRNRKDRAIELALSSTGTEG